MVSKHVKMELNCVYGENEDESIVVSCAMEHTTIRDLVVALMT